MTYAKLNVWNKTDRLTVFISKMCFQIYTAFVVKWTWRPEFKFLAGLFAFQIVANTLGKSTNPFILSLARG